MIDVAVAIINYNTRAALHRCLASLPSTVRGQPLRALVIDNASTDGSAALVRQSFPGIELVPNARNIGFARAVNQAASRTSERYLLVLNADTEISADAIAALYDFMELTPRAGVAGGKLVDEQGRLQHSCRRFYTVTAIVLRRTPLGQLLPRHAALRHHLMLDWDHDDVRDVDWLQGSCLMLRRTALHEVGGMDGRFFLYFEDVDLCRRLHAAGWGVYYVPQARLVHSYRRGSHGRVISVAKVHHALSSLRYFFKWHVRPRLDVLRPRERRS
jgi:hypothetical protein